MPYFQNVSNKLLGKVCLALKNAIYLPSDVILHKGEYGHEMYIIRKGTVQILAKVEDFTNPIMLKDGSFFGEMALVMEVRRTVSVEAKTMCELCYLEKDAFEFVIAEYVCFMSCPLYFRYCHTLAVIVHMYWLSPFV